MKKSNIIIICTAVLAISWLLISGWLQANAYNTIKSGGTCSYATVTGEENVMKIKAYKNISVDAELILITPSVNIRNGDKSEISFSNSMKNAVYTRISGDTLYLNIVKKTNGMTGYINIYLPVLNSVNINTTQSGISTIISGFKGNTLSINNEGSNGLNMYNNQFIKLVIRGNFYNGRDIQIQKSTKCDSLDIDIEGQDGSLTIGNDYLHTKEYPVKWSSIKIPESFSITAKANIASKIILKK